MLRLARQIGLRRFSISFLILLVVSACGCAGRVRNENTTPGAISNNDVLQTQPVVRQQSFTMRNIDAAKQLAGGIYGIENKQYRWTAGAFSVVLATPSRASTRGANLEFKFYLPDVILSRTGPITLTAYLDGAEVGMARYGTAGPQRFSATIPPALLTESPVAVDFHLDPFVPAGTLEARELGVIADTISLENQ